MTFDDLDGEQFIVLTTFRRDGTAVPTTVWFAHADDGIVVGTGAESGKLKRLRNDPHLTVTASNYRGEVKGDGALDGPGRILDGQEAAAAERALRRKYGWQWRLMGRRVDTFIEVVGS